MSDSTAPADDATPSNPPASPPVRWRTNLYLFVATAVSVFATGVIGSAKSDGDSFVAAVRAAGAAFLKRASLVDGARFAGTLLTILVAHEFGHYIAARIHKVEASLPYFIPMPVLSPFGTMGAVIRMRGTIPTRRALLDIGAAGPLAGLVFAIPLYAWGVAHSKIVPIEAGNVELGESVLIKLMDALAGPAKPAGMDVSLNAVAFGAWGGMFVTMINLLPVGQLDGGHVAYALFGTKQDRYAAFVHRALFVFFFVAVGGHVARDMIAGLGPWHIGRHLANSIFWLVWFQVLAILGILSARARGRELKPGEMPIRTRLLAAIGLVVVASLAREKSSWFAIVGFFAGLGMVVAMEIKGGFLRRHDFLDHPPTGAAPLDVGRKIVAIATLVVFALLFMPEPFSM